MGADYTFYVKSIESHVRASVSGFQPKITHPKHFWPEQCTAKIEVKSPCVLWPCFYRLQILLGATINALIWFDCTIFIVIATDYGRPMKFLLKSRNFWLWQTKLGICHIHSVAFGVFSVEIISTHFGTCLPLFNQYFYKKLSLYSHILNIYMGFEFGPQRCRD